MKYKYYLDESGNSGDLINPKDNDFNFGSQPIFTLSCVGIDNLEKLDDLIVSLRTKYFISNAELKSSELYFSHPEVFLDVAKFLSKERCPVLVELVDKKYCIATAIVSHLIIPSHSFSDESDGMAQHIRNGLADYISTNLSKDSYKSFSTLCDEPSEQNLINAMDDLKLFFKSTNLDVNIIDITIKSINATLDDYNVLKSRVGEDEAIKKFSPIPDVTKNGVIIKLLPHVHSIFNIIGRLNKYHLKSLEDVILLHDNQKDFDDILIYSKEYLETIEELGNMPPVLHSDYNVTEKLTLEFVDSKEYLGVQIADLLAGFFNRYINGLLYKDVNIDDIYHQIFMEFRKSFHPMSPLGVNFVIPESKQQVVFRMFNF